MFTVNARQTKRGYDFCELVVHCDITLYRRKINDGDNWEVQDSSGDWQPEYILNEIVTECFESPAMELKND